MQAKKRTLSSTKPNFRSADKTLTDLALLIEISQFLEDCELFNFIIITKRTYNVIKRSTVLEVRLLRYELSNAEKTLEKYKAYSASNAKKNKYKFKDMMSFRYNLMLYPRLPLCNIDPVMISHKVKDYFDFGKALLINNNQTKETPKLNKISDHSSFRNNDYDDQETSETSSALDDVYMEMMLKALQRSQESPDQLVFKMMRANFIQNNQPLDHLNEFIAMAEKSKKAIQTQEEHSNDPPITTTQQKTLSKKLSDITQDILNYLYNGPKYETKHL